MTKVILICGNGASSSFMATKLRTAIKEKNLQIEVSVSPETSLDKKIESFDYILIGPHLDFLADELAEKYEIKGQVSVIPYDIYATLDGSRLLQEVILANKLSTLKQL